MATTLMKAGADPNAQDEKGSTPLHEAASHDTRVRKEVQNIDPKKSDEELANRVAVSYALIRALISMGADPKTLDDWG